MRGGTGIFIDDKNLESNFIEFLENSSITFLSKGSFGVVYRATANPGYISKYKNIDFEEYDTQVNTLIVKISCTGYIDGIPGHILHNYISPISILDFKSEVNIQTDVFLKTMNTLQPLCPAIVFSDVYTNNNKQIINTIINKLTEDDDKQYLEFISNNMTGYSVIGMEMLKNYETAYDVFDNIHSSSDKNKYMEMVAFILIELIIKTGYSHSDFHLSNIMINTNSDKYFKGLTGSIMLIDFGLAVKIPLDTLKFFKKMYETNNYKAIMNCLCMIPRSDGYDMNTSMSYKNVCNYKYNNQNILSLFNLKQEATDEIISEFNSKSNQRDKYPLLPLSNNIKNKMFPGLIDDIIKTQFITLNVPSQLIQYIYVTTEWIIDVVTVVLNTSHTKTTMRTVKTSNAYKCMIDSIYICAYLMNTSLNERRYYQMAALIGMYCSGIDETFSYSSKVVSDDIYKYFSAITLNLYNANTIKDNCKKYSEMMKSIKINTIYNYMSLDLIENLHDDASVFKKFKSNILNKSELELMLNNPKEWSDKYYPPNKGINQEIEEYAFPFKTDDSVYGGKKYKKRVTRITRITRNRKNKRNKTKKTIKRK